MPPTHGKTEFRPIVRADRERILEIAARTWEGHDYMPAVFDRWVAAERSYFGGLTLDGKLVGCGRILRLDARRGWLEGLRVHPDHYGAGLGRAISRHVIARALAMELTELLFSTYFRNHASIAISEALGFRRIASYTHLEREALPERAAADGARPPVEPRGSSAGEVPPDPAARVSVQPGIPDVRDFMWNDWFFVPSGVDERESHFPNALTMAVAGARLVLCDNVKYPDCLEISWLEIPGATPRAGADPPPLRLVPPAAIDAATEVARRRGRKQMHLMLPAGFAAGPFLDAGFMNFEQEHDVLLYRALASEIRLD